MENQEQNKIIISVIMPIYNTKRFLLKSLDSVRDALDGIDSEVICVDDGSTDGSEAIVEDYCKDNPNFKVFHIENVGPSLAREYGLAIAKGKYIAFVDSDDYIAPFLYRDMLYICEKNKIPLCACNITRVSNDDKGMVTFQYQLAFAGEPKLINTLENKMSVLFDGSTCNKLILREFWDKNGFSFPVDNTFEDMELSARMYSAAGQFGLLHSLGYFWRVRAEGNSRSQNITSIKSVDDRIMTATNILNFLRNEYGASSPISVFMEKRIVCWEFDVFISNLESMDARTRAIFVKRIGDCYKRVIREESLKDISVFHKRKYEYIVSNDVEGLIRLMNHKKFAWRSSAIETIGEKNYLLLPRDIYGTKYADASVELKDDLPLTRLRHVSKKGSKMTIEASVYQSRVNIDNKNSQLIEAYLYNELTGESEKLQCHPVELDTWTDDYGIVVSHDDYKTYQYNHDWSGVEITIDLQQLTPIECEGEGQEYMVKPRWLLYIRYKTPVLEGHRPFRGILARARSELNSMSFVVEKDEKESKYIFFYDIRETLYIELE